MLIYNSGMEPDPSPLLVAPGIQVELELLDDEPERLVLEIVPDAQADFYAGYLGESTPLAQSILGRQVGETVKYPGGRVRILVLRIGDHSPRAAKENADQRQQALAQARKEIARTNAIVFSSTVEGKWGEYDTDGIEW
jgi:hypothetical protein